MTTMPCDQLYNSSVNNHCLLRRAFKIKSSRLPSDFFKNNENTKYDAPFFKTRKLDQHNPSREPTIPSFSRKSFTKFSELKNVQNCESQRKVQTARPSLIQPEKQQELIHEIITTTRRISKVFKRQSLELKNSKNIDFYKTFQQSRLKGI